MTPIDIQVSRSKVSVEGQAYFLYVGEGGISVLQTAIFFLLFIGCFMWQYTIFQPYVTAHRCAGGLKEKVDLTSGSHTMHI